MSRWATVCEIAGVSFTGCRAEIVNGNDFLDDYAGSVDWGNKGGVHPQEVNRGVKGIQFGIHFMSIEISKLNTVRTNVMTAKGSNSTFRVTITDDPFDVDVNAVTDPTQQQGWLGYGPNHSEGWAEDITLWFISKTAY